MTNTQEGVDTLEDLVGATSSISIDEVLRCIMKEFGGASGFAVELMKDFNVAPKGGMNRIRIETAIIAALQKLGVGDDEGSDDIEDLENQARQLMGAADA